MVSIKSSPKKIKAISLPAEETFRLLFANHPIPMFVYDQKTLAFLEVNDAALGKYGYARGEFLSLTIKDIRPKEDITLLINNLEKDRPALQHSGGWRHRHKNGRLIEVEITSHTLEFDGHEAVLVMAQDVTESKQAELALRESEASFQSLFDDSPISLWEEDFSAVKRRLDGLRAEGVVDFDAYLRQHPEIVAECVVLVQVMNVNKATLNLYGAASKEDLVKSLATSLPKEGNEYFRDELVLIASGATHFEMELIAQTLNGRMITINLNWAVVHGYESDLSKIIVSIIDITERKHAEAEVTNSEKRFRGLIENGRDNISLLTADGILLWESPSTVHTLGYMQNQFLGGNMFELIHPDDKDLAHNVLTQATQNPGSSYEGVFRLLKSNGSWCWIEATVTNLLHEASIQAIVINYRDNSERRQAELEREALAEIMQGLVVTQDLKDFLRLVHHSIAKVIFAENFFVILYNSETALFEEVYSVDKFDPPAPPSQLENSISAYVFRTGQPLLLTQAHFDELVAQGEMKLVGVNSPSWLGVPLKTSSETIGVMAVQDYDHPNRYSERSTEFLFSIAGQVALAVERKQADVALYKSEERYRTLFDSMMDGIYRSTHAGKFVEVNLGMVRMFGYSSKEEMLAVDIMKDLYFEPDDRSSLVLDPRMKDVDVYRMRRKNGSEIWVEDHGYYVHDEQGNILYHEGLMRDITERKHAEEELLQAKEALENTHKELEQAYAREQYLSHIDELTGINNRRSLVELAEREFNVAMRYSPPLSVLMFDIDYFKQINDTFGHLMGDQVLKSVTQTVRATLRSVDIIGRYGGDEFVVLLPQTSMQEALPVANRIHASIASICMESNSKPISITISIGVAQTIHNCHHKLGHISQSDSVENLFLRADQALYAAKQAGRNCTIISDMGV